MKNNLNSEEMLDKIDEWHESNSELSLHEYLEMSWEEYVDMITPKKNLIEIENISVLNLSENDTLIVKTKPISPKMRDRYYDIIKKVTKHNKILIVTSDIEFKKISYNI